MLQSGHASLQSRFNRRSPTASKEGRATTRFHQSNYWVGYLVAVSGRAQEAPKISRIAVSLVQVERKNLIDAAG
jgi:hypothetical protein